MATSGVSSYNITRDQIINDALLALNLISPIETATATEIAVAKRRLNNMIKAWQGMGIGLWLNDQKSLTLVVGQQSYLFGPGRAITVRPLTIVEARLKSSDGIETMLEAISRDEYFTLPLKTSTGKPSQYYYDPQLTDGVFYIWPTADDDTDSIQLTIRTPIEIFVNLNDNPDFPIEWAEALVYNLAKRLAADYEVSADKFLMISALAKESFAEANNFDREPVSTFFMPAPSPYGQRGR